MPTEIAASIAAEITKRRTARCDGLLRLREDEQAPQ